METHGPRAQDARPIRVFLVDDHEILRVGLRKLLAAEPDVEVAGEAATARAALDRVPALAVDVAVLDMRLPDGDGAQLCRGIKAASPATGCLMLSGYGDERAVLAAVAAGAGGYVMKQAAGTELVTAVRAVAAGRTFLGPEAAQQVMARLREQEGLTDPLAALSGQEKRVLELVGEGLTNRQIAGRMFLSEPTVKNYVSSVLAKLGMQRRSQVAALAARISGKPGDGAAASR
jgi:DNA-binding NarL/FixJ family response regulator